MKKLFLALFLVVAMAALSASNIVTYGNDLIRINFEKNTIEASTNGGHSWVSRYTGSYYGVFLDLAVSGNEILAVTSKGVYASTNGGRSWVSRYTGTFYGSFQSIACSGKEVLATTSKGLYASTNGGRSWVKRH